MRDYPGTEIIASFEDEPILPLKAGRESLHNHIRKTQKRIVFASGRWSPILATSISDIPYTIGQEVSVTYSGPCVNIDKGQEVKKNEAETLTESYPNVGT